MNSDLTFSSSFEKNGSGEGQFHFSFDIACEKNGKVYVADRDVAEGKFLRMFGRHGYGRGELYYSISIAIDTSDRVYVGNWNHRISVITSEGQLLHSV